jgi:hypothetical protein
MDAARHWHVETSELMYPSQVWTSSNLHLHEVQTKYTVHSQAAEEVVLEKKQCQQPGAVEKHPAVCEHL